MLRKQTFWIAPHRKPDDFLSLPTLTWGEQASQSDPPADAAEGLDPALAEPAATAEASATAGASDPLVPSQQDAESKIPLLMHAEQCKLRSDLRKGDPEAKSKAKAKRKAAPKTKAAKARSPKTDQPPTPKASCKAGETPSGESNPRVTTAAKSKASRKRLRAPMEEPMASTPTPIKNLLAIEDATPEQKAETRKARKQRGKGSKTKKTDKAQDQDGAKQQAASSSKESRKWLVTKAEKDTCKRHRCCK